MAFQSIRFISVSEPRRSKSLLSLMLNRYGQKKDGEISYQVSLRIDKLLIDRMNWNEGDVIDVLVDSENQLCMLVKGTKGYRLNFPSKTKNAGYLKFYLHEAFKDLPKSDQRIDLNIVYDNDAVIFEIPKIKQEPAVERTASKVPEVAFYKKVLQFMM